jgi:integrase
MNQAMNDNLILIDAYSAHQTVRGFSVRTVDRRRWSLGLLSQRGAFGDQTPETIEAFLARWPSAQSRYSVRSDVRQFYRWGMRRGVLFHNPTDDVDPPRLPKRSATPIAVADLMAAIAYANANQRRAIMLGAYAGLRCSEIAALMAVDVHRDRGVIVVRNGKGGKDGLIPLAPELALVLPMRGKCVTYPNGAQVGSAIRRVFRHCGIIARPHDTRHTFGTEAAMRSNGNMELVRRLMRHESLLTTQRYIGWIPDGGEVVDHLYVA